MALFAEARKAGISSLMVLSTCNRTELWAFTASPSLLQHLLVKFAAGGTGSELQQLGYTYTSHQALQHAFRVGCGMDSQILGDYEITGQLRKAVQFAKQHNAVGPLLDRLINLIFQASKQVKNTTNLRSGTVSASFAAVEWLKTMVSGPKPEILLIGTGKFGHNLLKNLLHYLPEASITLCNRTLYKAVAAAKQYRLPVLPFEQMQAQVQHFEVVITCTHAPEPILKPAQFDKAKTYYLIDLSVPANIDAAVGHLSGVNLVNIDEISGMLQQTYARRKADLPAAEQIVRNCIQQFYNWLEAKRYTTVVNNLRPLFEAYALNNLSSGYNMNRLGQYDNTTAEPQEQVHAAVKQLMINLRQSPQKGCAILTTYQHLVNCN